MSDMTSVKSYAHLPEDEEDDSQQQEDDDTGAARHDLLIHMFKDKKLQDENRFIIESETTSEDGLGSESGDSEREEMQLNVQYASDIEVWRAQGLTERMIKAKLRELKK